MKAGGDLRAGVLAAAGGHILARAIHVTSVLGLADRFGSGPETAGTLAAATATDEGALRRLLHFLARHGFFEESENGGYALTDRGAMLRSDAPAETAAVIQSLGHGDVWAAFGDLADTVRSGFPRGRPAGPIYDPSGTLPHEASFSRAMAGYHAGEPEAVAEGYEFTDVVTVVDVGGSSGGLLSTILVRHPHLRGIVFDRPGIRPHAQATLAEHGLEARCSFAGGDFFAAVPEGGDLYILSHILHDWPDADALRILRSCRAAMANEARLAIIEAFRSPGGEGESEIPADLLLLAATQGRLRDVAEYGALLSSAGFRPTHTLACGPRVSLIEAVPE
ncbi:MAG TPA: methyltransferase [Allosphingosinicella sp.]|nr:methyltransferase [Allosphingosinicella sp.]